MKVLVSFTCAVLYSFTNLIEELAEAAILVEHPEIVRLVEVVPTPVVVPVAVRVPAAVFMTLVPLV